MADDPHSAGKGDQSPVGEAALTARSKRLGDRLDHLGRGRAADSNPGQSPSADPSAIARGFRLSTELVAGVLVGSGIGWLIDRMLGTSPLGMIVFLLLGFAAGILNVMRTAGVVPVNTMTPPDQGR
jgi:ATP synthase protein I